MFKTTLSVKGVNFKDFQKNIERNISEVKSEIKNLGQEVMNQMKANVSSGIHRDGSTGKLANAIDITVEEDTQSISVGIGSLNKLNSQAPYWFVVNYGVSFPKGSSYADAISRIDSLPKFIPGGGKYAPLGSFNGNAPDGRFAGTGVGRANWGYGTGNFTFVAKNPVHPINYIEKSSAWLSVMWGDFWSKKIK